ncbi:MAG: serine/threonine protein kinase [Myxococcales bacterium]|nr:serine/threonine protein kinase [Myxococcales bacterium]
MHASGDLVGPYRLVSQLGKGAMGEVWRARDERLDRYVALKVLPADVAGDVERRARMLREARAAAAIRHPSVVTLFDIVNHQGDDILVMELVEGRTLSDALRKDGAPGLEVALRWIEGVASALVAAHARGILHRDIKAANIMVTPDGVKVLDFGLAKLLDDTAAAPSGPRPAMPDSAIALDATMPSEPSPGGSGSMADTTPASFDAKSYQTHAGQLIGTPLYMAPEQIDGAAPDERSEVFSLGVLAHEILTGKPPYSAMSMAELFRQIKSVAPPALDGVPESVAAIVERALAKNPDERYPTMIAFRDAVAAERARLFAPPVRRWPLAVAAAALVAAAVFGVWWWRAHQPAPVRPGDDVVRRALEEYDVFYNDKSLSSLRAALAVAPDHPRANAYMILFGGAPPQDRDAAVAGAKRALAATDDRTKDRALVEAAIAYAEKGAPAARAALVGTGAPSDRELAFWAAELSYRAGNYAAAGDEYKALLADPAPQLRGRIYDHYSSVLLYLDDPQEALRIGKMYRDAFPGEADAVGVYATTLAAAGKSAEAITAAEEALRLSEGEDTLAGLGKVLAYSGDRARARELYQRSLDRAGASRRPVRRAALALLQWIDGDTAAATATVAPCLPGGADAAARERGACLFVAGVLDPAKADDIAAQLDALAGDATPTVPAYGAPTSLAGLVRARATFFGGACVLPAAASGTAAAKLDGVYTMPLDFFAAYHVPFFSTWALCERAALKAGLGDKAGAAALLDAAAAKAGNRTWLVETAKRFR